MERSDTTHYTSQEPTPDTALSQVGAVGTEVKDQARSVADTAVRQTKDVLADMGADLSAEAHSQKLKLVKTLEEFSTELEEVSRNGSGRVPSLAGDAAARTRDLSQWLEHTEGRDIVRTVEDFARRRPLLFILGSAGAGVVAGRLTRGMMSGSSNGESAASPQTSSSVRTFEPVADVGYDPYDTGQALPGTAPSPVASAVGAGSPYESAGSTSGGVS